MNKPINSKPINNKKHLFFTCGVITCFERAVVKKTLEEGEIPFVIKCCENLPFYNVWRFVLSLISYKKHATN